MNGMILDIQRMSTEDGPGLRTTVFLKGCPLHCSWCHNPESISPQPELEFFAERCMTCGLCASQCPQQALHLDTDGLHRDMTSCQHCLHCSVHCPSLAMVAKGQSMDADQLVKELLKDTAYFGPDGGVTLSGGEALMQTAFCVDVTQQLQSAGTQVALDTCGLCSQEALQRILPHVDLFLYDIKLLDPVSHKEHTGASNAMILKNLQYLADQLRSNGKRLWIRTPIIPGATDTDDNIRSIAQWIAGNIADVMERWELCAFNNLCESKYQRLGKSWTYSQYTRITEERMQILRDIAIQQNISPDRIYATGMTD